MKSETENEIDQTMMMVIDVTQLDWSTAIYHIIIILAICVCVCARALLLRCLLLLLLFVLTVDAMSAQTDMLIKYRPRRFFLSYTRAIFIWRMRWCWYWSSADGGFPCSIILIATWECSEYHSHPPHKLIKMKCKSRVADLSKICLYYEHSDSTAAILDCSDRKRWWRPWQLRGVRRLPAENKLEDFRLARLIKSGSKTRNGALDY